MTTMNGQYGASVAPPHEFASSVLFDRLSQAITRKGSSDIVEKIQGIICFRIKRDAPLITSADSTDAARADSGVERVGVWVVDLKHGNGCVMFDPQGDGDVTFTVSDQDLMKMAEGELDPKWATVRGKLKISGDYGLAMTILTELKSIDLVKAMASGKKTTR